jgi:DNA/RNA endonuclease YhcR with UshA esterase domain
MKNISSLQALFCRFCLGILLLNLVNHASVHAQQSAPSAETEPAIQWANVAQMIAAQPNSYFFLEAKIKSVKPPDEGSNQPYVLYVEDNTGIARVVIFQATWAQMENPSQYEPGILIQVYGKTNDYNSIRQLIAEGPKWIRMKPDVLQIPDRLRRGNQVATDEFIEASIGGLGIQAIGQKVKVRGIVKSIEASDRSRVPTKITLADSTGEIQVVYWLEVTANLTLANTPAEGRTMEFKGVVGEYKNVMQLVVSDPEHVQIVEGGVSMNRVNASQGPTQLRGFNGFGSN